MQNRYAFRVDSEFPQGRYIDLAPDQDLDDLRTRCIADARAMMREKIAAVHASLGDHERLHLAMLRFLFLMDKRATGSLTVQEAAWFNAARDRLARIAAIHHATDEIEDEIAALPTAAALFDHSASLADNPNWPE
jgi:hypothetical protein